MNSPIYLNNPKLILGSGSNILFTKDFDGLVILNRIKGANEVGSSRSLVFYSFGGGEIWDDIVKFSIGRGLSAIENLSGIPGTVGAAAVQNIGAYGLELKDVFESLEAVDLKSGKLKVFEKNDCRFEYRESIFKKKLLGGYIVTKVTLKLSKTFLPLINYQGIKEEIKKQNLKSSDPSEVRNVILKLRKEKIPDYRKYGNAGCFFKNPEVSAERLNRLKASYPDMPSYQNAKGFKIPAGWLIENLGFKGKKFGRCGVSEKHALILVNYGGASGKEILNLALKVKSEVIRNFGIELEFENVVV